MCLLTHVFNMLLDFSMIWHVAASIFLFEYLTHYKLIHSTYIII